MSSKRAANLWFGGGFGHALFEELGNISVVGISLCGLVFSLLLGWRAVSKEKTGGYRAEYHSHFLSFPRTTRPPSLSLSLS